MNAPMAAPSKSRVAQGQIFMAAWLLDSPEILRWIHLGADPMEADDNGQNLGHHLAKNAIPAGPKGPQIRRRMLATVQLLCELGLDWGAPDAKGRSALAALARMGPLESLELILSQPKALGYLGSGPGSAQAALEVRGGKAHAMAQAVVYRHASSEVDGGASSKGVRL